MELLRVIGSHRESLGVVGGVASRRELLGVVESPRGPFVVAGSRLEP